MITKMSKYAFMVYHKEYDLFLDKLRNLGVVHIQETKPALEDANLQLILSQRKRINTILRDFKKMNKQKEDIQLLPTRSLTKEKGLHLLQEIEELQEKENLLITQCNTLDKEIDYMKIWGDFSYSELHDLKEAGYKVTFFSCPTSKFDPEWVDKYHAIEINNIQSVSYFITITPVHEVLDIDAERPKMPDRGLKQLIARYDQLQEDINNIQSELSHKALAEYNTLVELDKILENEFNLSNVIRQTEQQADNKLMMLEGWIPTENATALQEELEKDSYFYEQLIVTEEDRIPIKLRNNKFTKLYEPITKMFALPKYSEFDPTPFFAPFFMLFFGLCFGDGGYGLLMILACAYFKRKVSPDYKPFLTLFQLFGLAAVIVGTLTGSFFGISLAEVPALVKIKDYFITTDNLMTISIVLGLIQIVFGKIVAALQIREQKGGKYSIAPFAWVFVIIALLIALGLPMLDVHLPDVVVTVMFIIAGIGFIIALLYNSPGKNVFMNFGAGLWNTYNMASGLLGDTLSYIRLFAIGLTGAILGGVFNSLAIDMTDGMSIVPKVLIMLMILLFGHSLNFALCTISALVHPLRLTFVEYYKNAEFQGGGKEYTPFKKV